MKWISTKDLLPTEECLCYVMNDKGYMRGIRAIYYPKYGVFVLYDPNYRESLTLDVTHYTILPS